MKTAKIMKFIYTLLIPVLIIGFYSNSFSQEDIEKKNEVKLKMIKEVNGETVVIDTTFKVSDLEGEDNMNALKEFLASKGLEDIDLNIVDIDDMDNMDVIVYDTDEGEGAVRKKIIMKSDGDKESEEEYNFMVITSDSSKSTKKMTVTVDGDHSYYFTDDDEVHEMTVETNGDEQTIFVKKSGDSKEANVIISEGDMSWTSDDDEKHINIIEEDGKKKVIIKNEDGTTKEILLDDDKGAYMIDDDGNIKKVDDKAIWIDEDSEMITLNVETDDDGTIIIKKNGKTIELKDSDGDHNAFVYKMDVESEGDDEVNVFIEMIKKQEDDKTITVKKKVILKNVCEGDMEKLDKSGIDLKPEEGNDLKLEKLVFAPNPSDGKFTLKFNAPEAGKSSIIIYNLEGKVIYEETIKNFDGEYNKEVDISSEGAGTYFLKIQQGKKFKTQKIIIE